MMRGLSIAVAMLAVACTERAAPPVAGDPAQGARAIQNRGCGACHSIPGVRGARGRVGPDLDGFARRTFIAGELPNTPDNVATWISHPHSIRPKTAMPELDIENAEARDITAFLYTLDGR